MDRIGRYKIVRELGRGAMGVVYHAIDPNIGRPVAIKTIQLGARTAEEQERLRERLFREARSAGILSHPGIVTVYDVEQQEDGAYIAMEFVDGPTLDQLLAESKPLDPDRLFGILSQTAAALDYAHQKGIVHRDIKPANIMIAAGIAKITDFGIAKIASSEQFTMTGSIVGTPHYMSPEQVQGQVVDGRSDQFSLCVIAFEMLTGEKPYTGEHLTTVVYKIVAEEPAAPHRLNSTLGGAIENVLRRGLAKKPDARYRTCSEFVDALEKACAATKGWKALPRGASLNEPTVLEAAVPKAKLPPARKPRRAGTTGTVERGAKAKSGFVPFLLAILVAATLLALIGWQAAPWFNPNQPRNSTRTAETRGQDQAAQQPAALPAVGADGKPSPMPPPPGQPTPDATANPPATDANGATGDHKADDQTAAKPPDGPVTKAAQSPDTSKSAGSAAAVPPRLPARNPSGPQPILIISSPGDATVTLDGRSDNSCTTPCSLTAPPGRHTIALIKPGYQIERREVEVGTEPQELPAIMLRAQSGTLMLTSSPLGATIRVNGKVVPETTPAQLSLAPGTYKITVEKNGRESTNTVEIKNGDLRRLQVNLGQ